MWISAWRYSDQPPPPDRAAVVGEDQAVHPRMARHVVLADRGRFHAVEPAQASAQRGLVVQAAIERLDEHAVQVEQQPASGTLGERVEEVGLADHVLVPGQMGAKVLDQDLATQALLHRVHLRHQPRQAARAEGNRQRLVRMHDPVTMPHAGEAGVFRHHRGLDRLDQRTHALEVPVVDADRRSPGPVPPRAG